MSFTASAHPIDGALTHEIDVNGRHLLVTDEPTRLGGEDLGPAPHELLAAMVASCVSTMLVMYARNRGWDLRDVRVDVDYDPELTPRRVAISVRLPGGLSDEQVRRLQRVAETCPVRRALEAPFAFEEQILVETLAA